MAFPIAASAAVNNGGVPGKPSGLAVGDLLVLCLAAVSYVNNYTATASPPDGTWTAVRTSSSPSNAMGVWYKIATATEVAASSFGALAGDRFCGSIIRITGTDHTTPVIAATSAVVSGSTIATGAISPAVQSLFLNIVAGGNANASQTGVSSYAIANSNPSWNSLGAVASNISSNESASVQPAWGNETGGSGSSTGTVTDTLTVSSTSIIALLAIQPPTFTPSPFTLASVTPSPAFTRRITPASFTLAGGLGNPAVAEVAAKVRNLVKHAVQAVRNVTKH